MSDRPAVRPTSRNRGPAVFQRLTILRCLMNVLWLDLVLKIDVQCPIEAVKLFGLPGKLMAFKEKPVLHHPSGELLLRPEDYITWDAEGRALLERDANRHRPSFGSFWTKHQSKVRTSDRPAVLVKSKSFADLLEKSITRRMPSRWQTGTIEDFEPFKLPSFAGSPISSLPSDESVSHDVSEKGLGSPVQQETCNPKSTSEGAQKT